MSTTVRSATSRPKSIVVEALARVEGEGGLAIQLRGGQVADVKLRIYEPPRFFEAFLRGRSFREVPDITARICGICPIAYQMSAVHAIEKILGVAIDPAVRLPCWGVIAPALLLPPAATRPADARARSTRTRSRSRSGWRRASARGRRASRCLQAACR